MADPGRRCGHLAGKTLVSADRMAERVAEAAAASQDCSGGDFVVCARTDARGVEGLDAAVRRCIAYVDAGGANVCETNADARRPFEMRSAKIKSGALEMGSGSFGMCGHVLCGPRPKEGALCSL